MMQRQYLQQRLYLHLLLFRRISMLKETHEHDDKAIGEELAAVQRRANIITIGLTASIVLFGIFGGIVFVRGITKPVQRVMSTLQKVSKETLRKR